jgi:hypothetical protein
VCRLLDRYQVGGYISEPCHPWDHLQDLILDLAGVTLVQGPEGAYPVVWDLDAPPEHARCHLVAGESVVRTSGPRYDRGRQDYRSELRLRYAIPADSGTTQRLHVHSGYEWESYSSSPAAIRGHLAYGRQSEEADAPIVWEDSTAAALASRWVRWRALPLLVVEYDVLVEEVPQDPVGAQVLLTDADVSISSRVAYVRSVTYTDGTHSHLVLVLPEVI